MKVLKFGGTSVGPAANIRQVATILEDYKKSKQTVLVVVSAMSGVTNRLIKLGERASVDDAEWRNELINLRKLHLDTSKRLIKEDSSTIDFIVKSFEKINFFSPILKKWNLELFCFKYRYFYRQK